MNYIVGNNLDVLRTFEDNSISLSINSPPYKNEDNFESIDFRALWLELYRVHKDNSLFFLNFGSLAGYKERPFLVMLMALEAGWKLNDTITWVKPQYSPTQGRKRLNNVTEFIFLLYKGNTPDLDRLSIGIPYEDASNVGRYSDVNLKCRGNVWRIGYETITKSSQKLHPLRFPLELPRLCIKLSGIKEGTVLDIFAGSGTTMVVAQELGLDSIGIDINPNYKEVFLNRINGQCA